MTGATVPILRRTAITGSFLLAAFASMASAQRSISAAGGPTSIVTRSQSELTIDAKEVGATLLLAHGVTGLPKEWFNNALFNLSAEKGKRTLFSKGEFVPGLKLEDRLGRFYYNDSLGYQALYMNIGYEIIGRKIARYRDLAKSTLQLEESAGTSASLGFGWNWKSRPTSGVFGLSATAIQNVALPTAKRASQVCTSQSVAVDSTGEPVTVESCAERFVGAVRTVLSGQLRFDHVSSRFPRRDVSERVRDSLVRDSSSRAVAIDGATIVLAATKLASDSAERKSSVALQRLAQVGGQAEIQAYAAAIEASRAATVRRLAAASTVDSLKQEVVRSGVARARLEETARAGATFGLVSAASLSFERQKRTAYGFAFGPAVFVSMAPEKILGAILLEINDATNALGESPRRSDRFSARLLIGVPF